jgi:hypothetical protein
MDEMSPAAQRRCWIEDNPFEALRVCRHDQRRYIDVLPYADPYVETRRSSGRHALRDHAKDESFWSCPSTAVGVTVTLALPCQESQVTALP